MTKDQEIINLAVAEGHDADIPTNEGALPRDPEKRRIDSPGVLHSPMTPSSFDKDLEKNSGKLHDQSAITSRAASTFGDDEKDSELSEGAINPNIVDWDGPDDPQNPKNWTSVRKWGAIAVVSLVTFLTPLGSSSFAPGVPDLMAEFHSDSVLLSGFVVSVYVLGFAFGPLIVAPMSEMYGRLPLYHICTIMFVVFNIACAVAGSLTQLIVFRFLAGTFGAAPLALGGGTIADLIEADQRAKAMAIWTLGPTVGPVIGPVAGGFICDLIGWRWDFWIISIAGGVVTVLGMVLMRETYAPIILARKTARLQKETGNMALRSKFDSGLSSRDLFMLSIVRPTKMLLFSPTCFTQSLYIAIIYSFLYIMFTTVSEIFEEQYHFKKDLVGLAFIGMGIGSFLGQFAYTAYAGWNYRTYKARGTLTPEHRLYAMVPGAFLIPIAFFWYGWSVEANVHWICPILATSVFGFGLLLIFMSGTTYLVDVFTAHAASAMAANTVLRSLFAAIIPLAGPTMYSKLGYGWGASLLAFISIIMIPTPFIFIKYGAYLRTAPRFQLKL